MRVYVVTASINTLENIREFEEELSRYDCKVLVIDESNQVLRKANTKLISHLPFEYYGVQERKEWFTSRFGLKYRNYLSVIPNKCHAETSFGFLVAYEEEPDVIIELDDDVFPVKEHNLVDIHTKNLFGDNGVTVHSNGKWYNSMENLILKNSINVFPRGHPYDSETRKESLTINSCGGKCVLNMGLWLGFPDLDAIASIYSQGTMLNVEGQRCRRNKVIVDKGTYFAICSMNTSFVPKIIPAFYQLYMNYMGIDRFDDIWSGIFLKKVADHIGDNICLGKPLVYHKKRHRNPFDDLRKELEGIIINEWLWKIIDSFEIEGETYWDSYRSLLESLKNQITKIRERRHQKFMQTQVKKMKLWLEIIDKIK